MQQVAEERSAQEVEDSSPLSVDRITEQSAFDSLRPEWNELLQSSDSDCLFLTWEWISTWWKHLGTSGRLIVFTIRSGPQLVAIAAFRLHPANLLQGRPFPALEFLGSGHAGSDYLDLIARRGREDDALDALSWEWAANKQAPRSILKWTNLRKDNSLASRFAARLVRQGWSVEEAQTNVCPYIPLQGQSWDSYLEGLGTEHQRDFKRKWKRLNRDYAVRFELITSPEECGKSIDLLIVQHNLRWRGRGGSDAFHTPGLLAFHRDVSRGMLEQGWLRLYTLFLNEAPAASIYGFLYGEKFYFYQSGFDAGYEKYSVGMLTMGLAIKSAIAEGAAEYDLLHGAEPYKSHWSRHSRALGRLELYPPGIPGWFYRRATALARLSRSVAKRISMKTRGR